LRKLHNLTQAELGAKLNVTAQAISKWENGQSEPDIESMRKLCDIFSITMDELIKDDRQDAQNQSNNYGSQNQNQSGSYNYGQGVPNQNANNIIFGYCDVCARPLYSQNDYMVRNDIDNLGSKVICKNCLKKEREEKALKEIKEHVSDLKKGLLWGALATIALIALFIFIGINEKTNFAFVGVAIISCYAIFAFISQLFYSDLIQDMMDFFKHTFQMPGLIFTLDLDGIIWFITVKILLGALLGLLSVLLFLVGCLITSIVAMFSYPFTLIAWFSRRRELYAEYHGIQNSNP
jgi:DNA-binding XRE family transcriptional regulator